VISRFAGDGGHGGCRHQQQQEPSQRLRWEERHDGRLAHLNAEAQWEDQRGRIYHRAVDIAQQTSQVASEVGVLAPLDIGPMTFGDWGCGV